MGARFLIFWYTVPMKKTVFQMLRFGVVGSSHLLLDLAIYYSLTRGVEFFENHYLGAAVVSFCLSSLSSFFWNKHWTFKHKVQFHHMQLVRFYGVVTTALVINQLVLWAAVRAGLFDIYAKVVASLSAGLINFTMQKLVAFPHRSPVVEDDENEYTSSID